MATCLIPCSHAFLRMHVTLRTPPVHCRRALFFKALEEGGPNAAAAAAVAELVAEAPGASLPSDPGALPTGEAAPATAAAACKGSCGGPAAFLFPGQGSQAVGMLRACMHLPAVK